MRKVQDTTSKIPPTAPKAALTQNGQEEIFRCEFDDEDGWDTKTSVSINLTRQELTITNSSTGDQKYTFTNGANQNFSLQFTSQAKQRSHLPFTMDQLCDAFMSQHQLTAEQIKTVGLKKTAQKAKEAPAQAAAAPATTHVAHVAKPVALPGIAVTADPSAPGDIAAAAARARQTLRPPVVVRQTVAAPAPVVNAVRQEEAPQQRSAITRVAPAAAAKPKDSAVDPATIEFANKRALFGQSIKRTTTRA